MWRVYITKPAQKQLEKFPEKNAARIKEILAEFKFNPFHGDIVKLDKDSWRRRMGNYRIIFQIFVSEKIVYIFDIKRRTSKTY